MAIDLQEKPTTGYDSDEQISEKVAESKNEALFNKIQQLEEGYMGSSANDLPDGHPDIATVLRKAEEIKTQKTAENDKLKEENESLFNNKPEGGIRSITKFAGTKRRQVAVSSVVVTLFSVIAALISFGSAPAQAIYLSNTMEEAHFFDMEDMGARRTVKLMLNMKYIVTGDTQKLRLGVIGNIYADKLTKNMKASGFEFTYTDRTRRGTGFTFDSNLVSENSKLSEIKGASPEVSQEYLKNKFDIDGKIIDGKLVIDMEGINNRSTKRAIRGVMRASGYANAIPAGRARLLAKRGGSYGMWHPMAKFDEKFVQGVDAKYLSWKKKYADRIKNGSDIPEASLKANEGPPGADGEPTPPTDAEVQVTEEGNKILGSGDDAAGGVSGKLGKINGGVAAIGAICAVKAVSNNIDNIRQNNVIVPMMRLGFEAIAVGNQIKAGKDVDVDQLAYYAKQYTDAKAKSWVASKSVQYELGQKLTGKDLPSELEVSVERNPVSNFLNSMDSVGLGTVCDAAGSPVGTVLSTVLDAATGPVGAAAGFAFSSFVLPEVITGVESWLGGDQVNLDKLVGPDFGSAVNYGSRIAANETFASGGGVPLTADQELALRNERLSEKQEVFKKKPVYARLFDSSDTSSLLSQTAMSNPGNITGLATQAASSFSGPTQIFGSFFSSIASPKVAALETYDYGFPKISYTNEEIDDPELANPYESADKVYDILNSSRGDEYIERMKTCFNVVLDKEGNVTTLGKTVSYLNFKDHPECSEDNKDWLRVRMYAFDTQLLSSAACFDGVDDKSCEDVGITASSDSVGTTGQPDTTIVSEKIDSSKLGYSSEKLSCAAGTIDLGVVVSKYSGTFKKEPGDLRTRLCRIPDIPGQGNDTAGNEVSGGIVVDAYVSAAWAALGKQAKADGVSLSAKSSFRLADSCGGNGDGSGCARPGQSMHQTGWAVDFNNMSLKSGTTTSCSTRARLPNNPGWAWMEKNAEKYGIKQYTYEAWHWDPAPMANRCGTGQ